MQRTPEEKAAQAEYMRKYRARNPQIMARQRKLERARERALKRLSEIHPAEFFALYEEEKRGAGLT